MNIIRYNTIILSSTKQYKNIKSRLDQFLACFLIYYGTTVLFSMLNF